MGDRRDTPVVVAYAGRGRVIDPEGRIRLERVDRGFLADYAEHVDCVLFEEPGGGLRALESLRETAVPTILYDRTADPAVAARATRLGVTEYVTDGTLADWTLADLLVAVVERDRADSNATEPPTALAELRSVLGDRSLSPEESIERLLEIGSDRLDLELGALAAIDGTGYTVVAGDETVVAPGVSLSETLCRLAVRIDGPLELPDTAWGPSSGTLAEPFARLGSYLGDDITIAGRRYGTVWFGDERSRPPFSANERVLFELLVELIGLEIERADAFDLELDVSSHSAGPLAGDGYGGRLLDASASTGEMVDTSVLEIVGSDGNDTEIAGRRLSFPPADTGSRARPGGSDSVEEGGQFRYLFDRLPDAAAAIEFEDEKPIVREVNEAFETTFGYDASAVVGRSLNDLIVPEELLSEAKQVDENTIWRGYEMAKVERQTPDGRRTFLFRGFCYRHGDTERGFGIYTDISEQIEQRRRLQVLHRVLRHNLRNETTVILGYADMLAEDSSDPECRAIAERIYEKAADVSKLGNQVRRIQQALDVDRRRVAIDPEPLAKSIAARFRNRHPGATIRVSSDATAEVVADELLETALANLVENAIEHHPREPTVEIELSPVDGERFDITVRDDGDGIPERERSIVSGDKEITQLDHSRGLGLWVSKWVARSLDGQLLFTERDTGAEVTLRLRRADGRTSE